jgi:two-component system, NarL family, sensor histidine kinase BarA
MRASEPPPQMPDLGEVRRLEDVLDRESLARLCHSFFDLFNLPVRVFSRDGRLLADVHEERAICRYLNMFPGGRRACAATVSAASTLAPTGDPVLHPCFTGALYRVVPIEYQGHTVGRFVLGPYLPAELERIPDALFAVDGNLDPEAVRDHLTEMPRVRAPTAGRITEHLRVMLDLILFSSHRAHLASEMHVASVRESYRELLDRTTRLQKAHDELKEVDRLKSTFLATISHELRTPLTSIIGYSEMLECEMAGALNEEQKEFVQTIRSKGDHLLQLITNLLDLSNLERGSPPLLVEHVDAADIVEAVARTAAPAARDAELDLVVDVPPDPCVIRGDPIRVRQVLQNLVDNAIKFTEAGGRIELSAESGEASLGKVPALGAAVMAAPRRALIFRVRDTGIGIPTDQRDRIFDAFYQVDGTTTRQHGGAGLGLAIVRQLVDAHGGHIEVESEPGRGTTFTITVPELDEGTRP